MNVTQEGIGGTLEIEIRELGENILVANDKLELAVLDVSKQLRAINNTLLEIAKEIRTHRG